MRRAAFLDRDGVINVDHGYVHRVKDFKWVPGVLEAAKVLFDAGYLLVVVTNQSGIGRGFYSVQDFARLTRWMADAFIKAEAPLSGVYFCPHHPAKAVGKYLCDCNCRKPKPGLLLRAAEELDIDINRSIMFGDKASDCTAGRLAGCRERILLGCNGLAVPDICVAPDATRAYQSLYHAVNSPWFQEIAK